MKFGPVPLSRASGAILAHAMDSIAPDGKAERIKKGTWLTDAHVAGLAAAGHKTVVVADLGDTDVHEDAAAARLARALVPDPTTAGLRLSEAATGRVNVFCAGAGVAKIDQDKITAFNRIDPMITIATVKPFNRMAKDGMLATIKIISYAVPETAVRTGETTGGALALAAPVHRSATLIETTFSNTRLPADKGRRATQARLQRLGVALGPRVVVRHDASAIATAIRAAQGDLVLLLTASATSDLRDVGPEAVRAAGGQVTRFGMPVDPGNLLFLGEVGAKPVIGLPGCARSPVLNGADWVLERVICGVPVSHDDIAAMGVGGLLKESPARNHPRRGSLASG